MRKFFYILFLMVTIPLFVLATDGREQRISPEDFRSRQETFITEKADLSKKEADKFFPLYFELQDKKREYNDRVQKLLRNGRNDKTTESEYEKILEEIYDLRLKSDKLDKEYYNKFKKVLSNKKIFEVHRAEMRFHRELLKNVNRGEGKESPGRPSQKNK